MTARCTSPFFTRPRGIASLIETMITSPTVAVLRLDPPSTLMHCTRRAPELSATSRFVCIWIMLHLPLAPQLRYRDRHFRVRLSRVGPTGCWPGRSDDLERHLPVRGAQPTIFF